MVPWSKLPKDVQKAILALIVLSAGSSVASCRPPAVSDPPPPPPKTAPPADHLRCHATAIGDTDSGEVPIAQPSNEVRPDAARRGHSRQDLGQAGAATGRNPSTLRMACTVIYAETARESSFLLRAPQLGTWQLVIGNGNSSALPLQLKQRDVAIVEWVEPAAPPQTPLPLAEIRTVDILWGDGLTFQVETPWPGARYRWSVSGGTLTGEREEVAWEPPAEPGCYLLQLVADEGYEGLAVDSLVLTVNRDDSLFIS